MIEVNFNNFITWIYPFSLTILIIYIINYITTLRRYPPGPLPLPFVGNLLLFRGKLDDPPPTELFKNLVQKYGPLITLWAGPTPIIFVNNFELTEEALLNKKNDFIGKPDEIINRIMRDGNVNITTSDGPGWEAMRKVGHIASRKFVMNDNVPNLTSEIADETSDLMLDIKEPFNPVVYIDLMVYNIISTIAYEKKYKLNDQEFHDVKQANDDFYEIIGNGLISEFIPYLRLFYLTRELRWKQLNKMRLNILEKNFKEHEKTYQNGIIRSFADSLMSSQEEAVKNDSNYAKYYNFDNLKMVISDLFAAANDTLQLSLRWMFLLLGNYPEIQDRILSEIHNSIGDRMPVQSDKSLCPYTWAFVLETLRYRAPGPFGLDRCTSTDTELMGYKLKKNERVFFNLHQQNHDPKYWKEPEQFRPERFLNPNTGQLITGQIKSFVTFSLGKRICVGERLAITILFLLIINLVKKIKFELPDGPGSAQLQAVNILIGSLPKNYQIKLTKRN